MAKKPTVSIVPEKWPGVFLVMYGQKCHLMNPVAHQDEVRTLFATSIEQALDYRRQVLEQEVEQVVIIQVWKMLLETGETFTRDTSDEMIRRSLENHRGVIRK